MKTALLCVVLASFAIATVFATSSSSEESCSIERASCVQPGDVCQGDFIRDTDVCQNSNFSFACCQYPLYCINGTCKEDNNGANCTEDSDCVIAFYGTGMHKCINNTCTMLMNANDYCTNNTDCVDNLGCIDGRCQGYPLGHECTPPVYPGVRPPFFGLTHYVCGEGLVCAPSEDNETAYFCVYGGNISQTCNKTHPCKYSIVCNDGRCIRPFTAKVGDTCDNQHACTCINGKCVQSTTYKVVKCEKNSDCGSGTTGICGECNNFTGQRLCGIPDTADYCSYEWNDAYECFERKKCAPVPGSAMSTCVQEQCTTETNNLLSCRMHCNSYRGSLDECAANLILRNCPKFPMWARIVTAFTILVIAIIIVCVIYGISLLLSKKKYSHLNSS